MKQVRLAEETFPPVCRCLACTPAQELNRSPWATGADIDALIGLQLALLVRLAVGVEQARKRNGVVIAVRAVRVVGAVDVGLVAAVAGGLVASGAELWRA